MKLVLRFDIGENEIPELFNESFWNYLLESDDSNRAGVRCQDNSKGHHAASFFLFSHLPIKVDSNIKK